MPEKKTKSMMGEGQLKTHPLYILSFTKQNQLKFDLDSLIGLKNQRSLKTQCLGSDVPSVMFFSSVWVSTKQG